MAELDGTIDGANEAETVAYENIYPIIDKVNELAREDYLAYVMEEDVMDINSSEMANYIQSNIQKWKYSKIREPFLNKLYCDDFSTECYEKNVDWAEFKSSKLGWIASMVYMMKFKKSWKSTFHKSIREVWESCFEEYEGNVSIYEMSFRALVCQGNIAKHQCDNCNRYNQCGGIFSRYRCVGCSGFPTCPDCYDEEVNMTFYCSKCSIPSQID